VADLRYREALRIEHSHLGQRPLTQTDSAND